MYLQKSVGKVNKLMNIKIPNLLEKIPKNLTANLVQFHENSTKSVLYKKPILTLGTEKAKIPF